MKPQTLVFFSLLSFYLYGQDCPPGALTADRLHKLYLYFPTAPDNSFPAAVFGTPDNVAPLAPFNITDLDSSLGSVDPLIDRIVEIVTEDYCEFNVEVILTRDPLTPTDEQWQIIGIGSDGPGSSFGRASDVDLNNQVSGDYARVWAGVFEKKMTYFTGPLHGSNSTIERWATGIGGTVSHEGGHNYGLGHENSIPRIGTPETPRNRHILASGNILSFNRRVSQRRHFSDQSYEILAHNVGLNIQSLYNWNLYNPNDEPANSMAITVLSTAPQLTVALSNNSSFNPWDTPTIVQLPGTQTFQGTTYNIFEVIYSTPRTWNGTPGLVQPGESFTTGVGLLESEPKIIRDVRLRRSDGTNLDLHPRVIAFDTELNQDDNGDLELVVLDPGANAEDEAIEPPIVKELTIEFLPRMGDLETMADIDSLRDIRELPIFPNGNCSPRTSFELIERKDFRIARLSDDRTVDILYDSTGCVTGPVVVDRELDIVDEVYCPDGYALSLFPSTMVYVTATVLDSNARYYNPDLQEFEVGPKETRIFYQFAGILPDFNENGIDDLIDIREERSRDENKNGVPDETERTPSRFRLPFGLGRSVPLAAFDNDFDAGYYIEFNTDFRIANLLEIADNDITLALNIEGGLYTFNDLQDAPYNIWALAAGLKVAYPILRLDRLFQSNRENIFSNYISIFADANAGAYNTTDQGWLFGRNVGAGLSVGIGSINLDLAYSRFILDQDIDFYGAGVSIGLRF